MTFPAPPEFTSFADEVIAGLDDEQPHLSSKWFYDDRGTELFRRIMACPEYYLTEAEAEIYRQSATDLLGAIGSAPFDLIELGAGDGSKTQLLIERFLAQNRQFHYRPIDLSSRALEELGKLVRLRWPNLAFTPERGDYFEALDRLGSSDSGRQRLVLFPGANVGNYSPAEAVVMLRRLRSFLQPGDHLLTGFDLKKDPAVVLAAYNDGGGLTAAFNLNLLQRINRELGADFQLDCWRHWETYDPASGAARSFLVPIEPQRVTLGKAKRSFNFPAWTAIQVEISQKYHLSEIDHMAREAGYECVEHFTDRRMWFTDSLWKVPNP